MKRITSLFLACAIILSGCSSMNKTGQGSLLGGGAGAVVGAAAGALISKDGKGAAIGAAIGTAIGAGAGAAIGHKMDKKAEELAALENAQVETITDVNGLEAIKVTFDSGILFPTNGTALSEASKTALSDFAAKMKDLPETDITVYGHTDNTGTEAVNERISNQRAAAVESHLAANGIAKARIHAEGKSFTMPVADNATVEGRAQNRRVEIYVSANEDMIKAAENGSLK